MTYLLDSNVLIALAVADHVHHQAVRRWWEAGAEPFATCPITQGALLRLLIREGMSAADAQHVLEWPATAVTASGLTTSATTPLI